MKNRLVVIKLLILSGFIFFSHIPLSALAPLCNGISATSPDVCSGNGDCTAPETCQCDSNWAGNDCQLSTIPVLDYPGGTTNGVSPGSGSTGTPFTFSVIYTSDVNAAPTSGELHIDINGDGSYGDSGQFVFPGSSFPPGGGLFLLLALTGLFLLFIRRRRAGQFPAFALALMVLIAGISSCDRSDDGNSGNNLLTGPDEIYTLIEVDPSDTDYTDGKEYKVEIEFNKSGTYTYTFRFSDGISDATGPAAAEKTLTVD